MRRRLALAVLLACLAGTVAVAPASALVLGSKSFMGPYGFGWGTKKPKKIFNGGAPSGLAEHLHWRHWGESVATARGRIALYKPSGGYYARRGTIKLRAYAIGPCAGRRAYTRLSLSVPDYPGGPFGPWQPWAGATTLCASGRALAKLDTGSLHSIDRLPRSQARARRCGIDLPSGFPGVTELRTTRVGCRDARGVARWIWARIHRKSLNGESFELPQTAGPVRGRTFSCGYHGVQDGDAFYYAARCSSGRAVVRFHLNS